MRAFPSAGNPALWITSPDKIAPLRAPLRVGGEGGGAARSAVSALPDRKKKRSERTGRRSRDSTIRVQAERGAFQAYQPQTQNRGLMRYPLIGC